MSGAVVVVGLQWGDEGKGKIVDWLGAGAGHAARFQGGHNAGHTVICGDRKTVLHLAPSAILHPDCRCYIGAGVVVDPAAFLAEIDALAAIGVGVGGRLFIAANAALILPYHAALDRARERGEKIGTTKLGIGPAHEDKAARRALRVGDLCGDFDSFGDKLADNADYYNFLLAGRHRAETIDGEKLRADLQAAAARIRPLIGDVPGRLAAAAAGGERVLLESAQGALLDCEQGSYPFVTSAHCLAGAAAGGLGVHLAPRVLGVTKAYATRVGEGPFPTEVGGRTGELLAARGGEFGATTGRPRRCGWLDIPALRHALRANGCDKLAITKLDILDALPEIKLCVRYETDAPLVGEEEYAPLSSAAATLFGKSSKPEAAGSEAAKRASAAAQSGRRELRFFPPAAAALARCRPVYERFAGWQTATAGAMKHQDLPKAARAYLARIEELTNAQIQIVSTGPARPQTIARADPFA